MRLCACRVQKVLAVTSDQRKSAQVPFVKRRTGVAGDDMSLVNELVLQTLASLIRVTEPRSGRLRVRGGLLLFW